MSDDGKLLAVSEDDWKRAALVCREVAELPDRTSPELNPDEMIVTGDELQPIVAAAICDGRRAEVKRRRTAKDGLRILIDAGEQALSHHRALLRRLGWDERAIAENDADGREFDAALAQAKGMLGDE